MPKTTTKAVRTIHDVAIGLEVKSLIDGTRGTVEDADGACIKVRWTDGEYSIYHRRDGFTLFAPLTGPAAL